MRDRKSVCCVVGAIPCVFHLLARHFEYDVMEDILLRDELLRRKWSAKSIIKYRSITCGRSMTSDRHLGNDIPSQAKAESWDCIFLRSSQKIVWRQEDTDSICESSQEFFGPDSCSWGGFIIQSRHAENNKRTSLSRRLLGKFSHRPLTVHRGHRSAWAIG